MENNTIMKQRLIGSLLLLLVIGGAAIFLIGQTNNDDKQIVTINNSSFVSSIEPMPIEFVEVDQETLLDPHQLEEQQNMDRTKENRDESVAVVSASDLDNNRVEVTTAKTSISEEKTAFAEKEIPTVDPEKPSWILQLGSFSIQANAQALHEKASKLGLKSRVEQSGTNYRVRIGPEYNKQLVDTMAEKISKQLGIKPQVLLQQTKIE
ncbi:MAG: SPOR domain-containing protein [Piscirickettsiaceae bacterium]|nr:SPOR domain-containing protein [Piscirickettsiaceae bacterium]